MWMLQFPAQVSASCQSTPAHYLWRDTQIQCLVLDLDKNYMYLDENRSRKNLHKTIPNPKIIILRIQIKNSIFSWKVQLDAIQVSLVSVNISNIKTGLFIFNFNYSNFDQVICIFEKCNFTFVEAETKKSITLLFVPCTAVSCTITLKNPALMWFPHMSCH